MMHDCGHLEDSWQCNGSHTPDKAPPSLRSVQIVTKSPEDSVTVVREYTKDAASVKTITASGHVVVLERQVNPYAQTEVKRGRPRKYATPADRQKAYRESKKGTK